MSGIQKMIKHLLILKTQFTTDFEKWKRGNKNPFNSDQSNQPDNQQNCQKKQKMTEYFAGDPNLKLK